MKAILLMLLTVCSILAAVSSYKPDDPWTENDDEVNLEFPALDEEDYESDMMQKNDLSKTDYSEENIEGPELGVREELKGEEEDPTKATPKEVLTTEDVDDEGVPFETDHGTKPQENIAMDGMHVAQIEDGAIYVDGTDDESNMDDVINSEMEIIAEQNAESEDTMKMPLDLESLDETHLEDVEDEEDESLQNPMDEDETHVENQSQEETVQDKEDDGSNTGTDGDEVKTDEELINADEEDMTDEKFLENADKEKNESENEEDLSDIASIDSKELVDRTKAEESEDEIPEDDDATLDTMEWEEEGLDNIDDPERTIFNDNETEELETE